MLNIVESGVKHHNPNPSLLSDEMNLKYLLRNQMLMYKNNKKCHSKPSTHTLSGPLLCLRSLTVPRDVQCDNSAK